MSVIQDIPIANGQSITIYPEAEILALGGSGNGKIQVTADGNFFDIIVTDDANIARMAIPITLKEKSLIQRLKIVGSGTDLVAHCQWQAPRFKAPKGIDNVLVYSHEFSTSSPVEIPIGTESQGFLTFLRVDCQALVRVCLRHGDSFENRPIIDLRQKNLTVTKIAVPLRQNSTLVIEGDGVLDGTIVYAIAKEGKL
ncbi:MAG: hypothetical protein ACTSYU_05790 [Promethearchaeota archaeon]